MNRNIGFCLFALLMFVWATTYASKKFTLVIDPGHGGKDHGAIGAVSCEKDLTLKFGLAFGKIIEQNCADVKVVYTRKTDVFIPLAKRAEIANKQHADLFISVHINAIGGGRMVRGVQTYTLGHGQNTGKKGIIENLEVAKRENAVIFLEKNYKQTYQGFDPNSPESNIMFEFIQDVNMQQSVELAKYMQRHLCSSTGLKDMGAHQNNLAVLRLTSMPGCLLELGFISTPDEENFMNSAQATELYAKGFFNAFIQYKNKYYQEFVIPYKATQRIEPTLPTIVPEKYQQQVIQSKKQQDNTAKSTQEEKNLYPQVNEKEKEIEKITVNNKDYHTKLECIPVDSISQSDKNSPIFKIQILSSSKKIPLNDKALKGLKDCECYQENGLWKYTYGSSADYNAIRRLRQEILNNFPDAFIIALKNGQRTDINQAIRTFLQNKKKK